MSEPVLRVVAGTPTDEELAAVVVALTSLRGAAEGEPAAERSASGWADRGRAIGAPLRPGPGAWVASARP